MHFARKFSREAWVQEKVLLGLHICLWEYTQKVAASSPLKLPQLYLMVQEKAELEHSSHIVKVGLKATCKHFMPWCILKETTETACLFATMPQEPWHPGKDAKLDCIIHLNHGEVGVHASYKSTRTWENFNN